MSQRQKTRLAVYMTGLSLILAGIMAVAITHSARATYSDPTYTTPFQIQQIPAGTGAKTQTVAMGSGCTLGADAGSVVDFSAATVTLPAAITSGTIANYTSSSGTLYNISAGTLSMIQPAAATYNKKVIVGATSLTSTGTTTLVFPTAFTQTPAVLAMSMGTNGRTYSLTTSGTGAVLTPSSTGATLSASNSAASGFFILEGN